MSGPVELLDYEVERRYAHVLACWEYRFRWKPDRSGVFTPWMSRGDLPVAVRARIPEPPNPPARLPARTLVPFSSDGTFLCAGRDIREGDMINQGRGWGRIASIRLAPSVSFVTVINGAGDEDGGITINPIVVYEIRTTEPT